MHRSFVPTAAVTALMLVGTAIGTPAMAASLIGDSITAIYYFPTDTSVYGGYTVSPAATFIVGPGVEATGTVDGSATTDFDFDASSLTLRITNDVSYNGASFNGWQYTDNSNNYGSITSVTGIDPSRVSASGNLLSVNWNGLSFANGDQIVVNFGAVPEPASWALMIAGFGLVGVAARRRRVAVAA